MLSFSIYDENNKVITEQTVSQQWLHQALVAFSARLSSRTKHKSRILSYSFDLRSCLHKYERLACRICCQTCQNVRFWIGQNGSSDDVQPSIILYVSKGGEVFLHFTLLHVAYKYTLVKKHASWLCSKVMSKSIEIYICW